MSVQWPDNTKSQFGKDVLQAAFEPATDLSFNDDDLAALLDAYPREHLGIWTFGEHREGDAPAVRGAAPDASGAEIIAALHRGCIWLNLRDANQHLCELKPVAKDIFDSLQSAAGRKVFSRDMGLLISSPKVHVHYHLDIPYVALFQLRGQKRIWLYPAEEDFAPCDKIEDMVHMRKEEDLPFRAAFDAQATIIDLKPGMGLTWPQTAPHRVQNEDCLNVSLSCEFMTTSALVHANALYANDLLRRQLKRHPQRPGQSVVSDLGKAAIARAMKVLSRRGPRRSPTPVTFHIDPSAKSGLRTI